MRIDKWLKVSRIIKRRETAKDLCLDGDILINGKQAKPMSEVALGDLLSMRLGKHRISAKILRVLPYAKKEDAETMYEILEDKIKEAEEHV